VTNNIPSESFTESIDDLINKIKSQYPSLSGVQVLIVGTLIIKTAAQLMDLAYLEKEIAGLISNFPEQP
jgi:hypothetical protein